MQMDWQQVGVIVTIFLGWSALLVGVIKILIERAVRGNDDRFKRIEKDLERETEKRRDLDKEMRTLQTDLPRAYVQREDWIRLATTIEAKMDALNTKFDDVKDRIHARG